jgi:uncharacterized protein
MAACNADRSKNASFRAIRPATPGYNVDGVPIDAAALRAWAVGLVLLAALGAGACGSSSANKARSPKHVRAVTVHVGGAQVRAEVAADAGARRRGLSGREGLAENRGMLFVFPDREPRTYWMKGMRFPLDIVWINRGRVTGIERDAPVPRGELRLYPSSGPVDRVLEVPAGWAARHGIRAGARVQVRG